MTNEQENQDVQELAFQLADRYIRIQETGEGYDYTIYDMNYRELDGGVYDNPDITITEVLYEIELGLKKLVLTIAYKRRSDITYEYERYRY